MDIPGEGAVESLHPKLGNRLQVFGAARARDAPDDEQAEASTEALEAAMAQWGDTVLRLAASRLGSRSDADDVYQTVFLRLFESKTRFRDSEHLKAWLLRVTVNCCKDARASSWRRHRAELSDEVAASLAAPVMEGFEGDEELARAMTKLSESQRQAVHLFYSEGYSTDEIAQLTDEHPATVRSHLHRARKILRAELGAQI